MNITPPLPNLIFEVLIHPNITRTMYINGTGRKVYSERHTLDHFALIFRERVTLLDRCLSVGSDAFYSAAEGRAGDQITMNG